MSGVKTGPARQLPVGELRIIQNIWLLARSYESLKGSSPMVRRLPSGPRACTNNYRDGLGSGAGERD